MIELPVERLMRRHRDHARDVQARSVTPYAPHMIPPAVMPTDGPDAVLARAILESLDGLLHALELEALGGDRFRVPGEPGRFDRVFGGQTIAQALLAAGATVDGKAPHSLHAYFVESGTPGET